MPIVAPFPTVDKCSSTGRESHTVVTDMDGTLLRGQDGADDDRADVSALRLGGHVKGFELNGRFWRAELEGRRVHHVDLFLGTYAVDAAVVADSNE